MENTCDKEKKSDLFVRVKTTKIPNTPLEPPSKITLLAIEVNEERTELSEMLEVNLHLQMEGKLTKTDVEKTA
jgi:hypothetical protein